MAKLDKVKAFLKENVNAEIGLSGHTSSEREAGFNRSLSYNRFALSTGHQPVSFSLFRMFISRVSEM